MCIEPGSHPLTLGIRHTVVGRPHEHPLQLLVAVARRALWKAGGGETGRRSAACGRRPARRARGRPSSGPACLPACLRGEAQQEGQRPRQEGSAGKLAMPGGHPPPPARLAVLAVGAGPGLPLIGGARGQARGLGAPPGAACPATHQACTRGLRPGNWFQRGSCCLRSQEEAVRAPGRERGGRTGGWRGGGLEFFLSTQGPHLPGGSLSPIPSATPAPGIEETLPSHSPRGSGGRGGGLRGLGVGQRTRGQLQSPDQAEPFVLAGGGGRLESCPETPTTALQAPRPLPTT